MEGLGWKWVPTMHVGRGCKIHLRADELPRGRLVCNLWSRDGTRCVYGYYIQESR
jgi:hypothetical protein